MLGLAEAGELTMVTTPAIMEELREVLGRRKFRLRIRDLQTSVAELVESLLSVVEVISDLAIEPVIKRDPDVIRFWPARWPRKPSGLFPGTIIY